MCRLIVCAGWMCVQAEILCVQARCVAKCVCVADYIYVQADCMCTPVSDCMCRLIVCAPGCVYRPGVLLSVCVRLIIYMCRLVVCAHDCMCRLIVCC